ncbi:MAG: integrase core domain-containing protein [Patescibacteria group bacterium]
MGIEVIRNDPYCPEQNGKIERFHKTVKREFYWKYCSYHDSVDQMGYKLYHWLNYYNTERRHGGFGMNRMTPQLKIASTLLNSFILHLSQKVFHKNVTLTLQQYTF